jgi:hypothetical protein
MLGTLLALYFVHRRERDAEREKRRAYWREQSAFRQNIALMRSTAQSSIYNLGPAGDRSQRSTLYAQASGSDDRLPLQGGAKGASHLRHAYSDDGNYSEDDGNATVETVHRYNNRF